MMGLPRQVPIATTILFSLVVATSTARAVELAELAARERGSIVDIRFAVERTPSTVVSQEGTGIVVSDVGDVLTASHLLRDWLAQDEAARARHPIEVRIQTRFSAEPIPVRIVSEKPGSDIVMLRLLDSSKTYRAAPLCYVGPPPAGTRIHALGFPTGHDLTPVDGTFSNDNNKDSFWEVAADANDGMTGGPVFNDDGYVVGLVESGGGSGRPSFVIPLKWARSLVEDRTATLPSCGPRAAKPVVLDPTVQIRITSPSPNASYPERYKVPFAASAFDPTAGALDAADYTWSTTSGLSLGTGPSIIVNTLPVGTHRVVLTTSDKVGRTNKATVDVTVKPAGTSLSWLATFPLEGRCGAVQVWDHFVAATTVNEFQHDHDDVSIFDVSVNDPPRLVSTLPVHYPSRVVVGGQRLFVSSEDGSLQIFDVREPHAPKLLATSRADPSLGTILEMAYDDDLIGLRGLLGVVELVDVTGSAPRALSWFPKKITAQGGLGFFKGHVLVPQRYAGLTVYDVTEPAKPLLVGTLGGSQDEFSSNVEIAGDFAFVDSYAGLFESVYLGDVTEPKVFGRLPGTGNAFRIARSGAKVFVAGNRDGLQVVDVSSPVDPKYDSSFPELGSVSDVSIDRSLIAVCSDEAVRIGIAK